MLFIAEDQSWTVLLRKLFSCQLQMNEDRATCANVWVLCPHCGMCTYGLILKLIKLLPHFKIMPQLPPRWFLLGSPGGRTPFLWSGYPVWTSCKRNPWRGCPIEHSNEEFPLLSGWSWGRSDSNDGTALTRSCQGEGIVPLSSRLLGPSSFFLFCSWLMQIYFVTEKICVFFLESIFLLLLSLEFLFNLGHGLEPLLFELFKFLNPLPDLSLFDDSLHQFLVVVSSIEPGKNFQHIVHLFLLLCSGSIKSDLFFQIEETPADNKFLPSYSLI